MTVVALVGDLHYPELAPEQTALQQAKKEFFTPFLEWYFGLDADIHMSIGDLTHSGRRREFQDVVGLAQRFRRNFRLALGNHDVLGIPKQEILGLIGHPRYGEMEADGARILWLDTTKEGDLSGWGLDEAQWAWLQETLERPTGKPLIVFAHHPVQETTAGSPLPEDITEPSQTFHRLLTASGKTLFYFNGHIHRKSFVQKGNGYYFQTASVLFSPCAHLIQIEPGRIRLETVSFWMNEIMLRARDVLYGELPQFHRVKGLSERHSEDFVLESRCGT